MRTTLPKEVLSKYPNKYFIETGTYKGYAVELALGLGIFDRIISIEVNEEMQRKNVLRLKDAVASGKVELFVGMSVPMLLDILPLLMAPATFWLDAHESNSPIFAELGVIGTSPIKNHTILIDDMRIVGKETWGKSFTKDHLIREIKQINNQYQIHYEDNTETKDDIMVATI